MKLPRNFLASVCLAAALAGVAVITAAVGQTMPSPARAAMPAQLVPVRELPNPGKLRSADVIDSAGKPFGKVMAVKTGPDGRATRVKVALMTLTGQGHIASIRADLLTYDSSHDVVIAQLSRAQVEQIAASASTAGFMGPGGGSQAPRLGNSSNY